MSFLLRGIALISAGFSLLIFAGIAIGHITHTAVQTGNLEVEGFTYILYIEDQRHDFRITLAGTLCFPAPPVWARPGASPVPYDIYARFFLDQGDLLLKELARCQALMRHGNIHDNP